MADHLSPTRRAWAVAALATALLVGADLAADKARLDVDGFWDAAFFDAADAYQAGGYRVLGPGSELVLSGLWARSPLLVEMDVEVGQQKRAGLVPLSLDNVPAVRMRLQPGVTTWRFAAVSDAAGRLQVRLDGERWVRVRGLRLEQYESARVPARRLAEYVVLACIAGWVASRCGGSWLAALGCLAGSAVVAAWIVAARLLALSCLSWIVWPCALGLAAFGLARRLAMPASHTRFIAAAATLKLLAGTHPAIEQPDLVYHAHQTVFFQEGRLILGKYGVSEKQQMLLIPYPPALYVALQPFVPRDWDEQDRLRAALGAVRWAMPLLEVTAPFLVFAIARAGGAGPLAASASGVAAAVMPEGLLVVLKSVAANMAGSWASLLFLAMVLARARAALLVPAAALAFLGHPGAALTLACLLPAWAVLESRRAGWRRPGAVLLAALIGGTLAWVLYYRATSALVSQAADVLARWGASDAPVFFRIRWVHLGKIVQDLLLKFGGTPLLLAWIGLRGGDVPPRLKPLLVPWLLVALAFAAAAVLTPVSLRFEYFATPAVALAAGLGAAQLQREGGGRRTALLWGLAFAIQVLLGAAALAGRLRLIGLIIPAQRWPFPIQL